MKKRESVIRKTCTFIILLMLAFSMGAFPLLSFNTAAEESHSFVRIWVDKGCGESYKSGERIKISFKVESFEPEAPVTIIWNIPGKEPEYVVLVQSYPTNEENSLVKFAKCPGGKHKLEIFVTSPSVESPPEEVPPAYFSRKVDIDLDSECIFYVDPGSEECGDDIDNDCDGKVDEDCLIPIVDHDGDGYYLPADCNDDDPNIHPGAGEVCDGKDNNCNGRIDEDCYICFSDHDGDGYTLCYDCNDYDRTVHPRAAEFCDGKDNDCDGVIDEDCIVCSTDIDGDGYTNCEDCNDYDSSVYPRAYEACDEKDNDCDGVIDEDCPSCLVDHDGDGFASCTDCDDNNSYVYPGAPEFCDRKDNDCDGLTDEGLDCGFVDIWVAKGCGADYRVGDNVGIFFKVHSSALSAKVTVTYFTPRGEPGVLISDSVYESNMVHRVDTLATCPEGLVILIIVVKVTLEEKMVILFDYCAFYVVDCRILDSDGDGHNSIQRGGDDCDDYDSDVHPGAEEVCDRKDNDCDGLIDEGGDCEYVEIWVDRKCGEYYDDEEPIEVYFRVNSSVSSARVSIVHFASKGEPATLASNRTVRTNEVFHFPLFALCPAGMHTLVITVEVVIEGRKVVVTDDCFYYVRNCRPLDNDGDGYISIPKGGDDCDDDDPGVHPGAEEVCDGKDNNCDGLVDEGLDHDGDGYTECRDCDDTDPSIHPGAEEVCDDNINNDCDDEIDETADKDKDGHNAIECGGDDCDDTDPSIYPGAEEVCDGKDNNCDGVIDEGFDEDGDGYTRCENDCDDNDPDVHPGAEEVCDDSIDNDCDEEVDETADKDNDGYKSRDCGGSDCNDNDPNVYPRAEEICDGKDNNCNRLVDEGFDIDWDGYKPCEGDCDDNDPSINPKATEICDGKDNNCNELIDEGFDNDGDGYTECGGDCDDTDSSVNPEASEIQDGKDNDCDGEIDEVGTITIFVRSGCGNPIYLAEIYLDGEFKGETNIRGELAIPNVEQGNHTILAKKDYIKKQDYIMGKKSVYEEDSKNIDVNAGETKEVHLELVSTDGPICFSGYEWYVRDSEEGRESPPKPEDFPERNREDVGNYYSSSEENVRIDDTGYLHLRIDNREGKWYCAEVFTKEPLWYGEYVFYVIGRIDQLDPNVVFGMFNYWQETARIANTDREWNWDEHDGTNEIDIEFAAWGVRRCPWWWLPWLPPLPFICKEPEEIMNSQFVVWPLVKDESEEEKHQFNTELNGDWTTHIFDWQEERIIFLSLHDHLYDHSHYDDDDLKKYLIQKWEYENRMPDEPHIPQHPLWIRINLWIADGIHPYDNKEVEIIIKKFEFIESKPSESTHIHKSNLPSSQNSSKTNHNVSLIPCNNNRWYTMILTYFLTFLRFLGFFLIR